MRWRGFLIVGLALLPGIEIQRSRADDSADLAAARSHLNRGRYEEAIEAFTVLGTSSEDRSAVALGLSRAHESIGESDKATAAVESALQYLPNDAALRARLGELHFRAGRLDDARREADLALKIDQNQPLARLVVANHHLATGRFKEANEANRWFVRYYNQVQPEDADVLLLVARGAVRYARWNRNTQIYNFAVNTLCPDALKKDPECWRAYEMSGTLLLEKYNREQALPELHRALAINPRAAEVLALMGSAALDQQELELAARKADEALAVNPRLVEALIVKTDVELHRGRIEEARLLTDKARSINPIDERTLARLAACNLLEDGVPEPDKLRAFLENTVRSETPESQTRFASVVIGLTQVNQHPGRFFTDLGELMEVRRQLRAAEVFYQHAVAVMPQLPEPKNLLGLLYMRTGKTDEARKILDEAFLADPYHVRISNMRKVIRVLDGYDVISTDHFVIRVDSKLDETLGRYMAEYLEDVYAELTQQYGYEPPQRTQFEIFNRAAGLSAHEWFSARMVGLPWIQTIGASTGMMVAMASPTAAREPFNWARVLKHELVHVITMQQTNFNIPHWFTEALAVTAEDAPRPELWDRLLLERVPAGNVRNLNTLDDGFQRPKSPDDWQFAYCQSRLYAQLLLDEYGPESIRKLLDAYRDKLPTSKAIERALGVTQDEFEKQYRQLLDRTVEELKRDAITPPKTLDEAERAYRKPNSRTAAWGEYADALFRSGQRDAARKLARDTLDKNPAEPLAAVTLARLESSAGNPEAAAAVLEQAFDREHPRPDMLLLFGEIELRRNRLDRAIELFELGRAKFPRRSKPFLTGLATAGERNKDIQRAVDALEDLAELDPDDPAPRKKLAQFALDLKNWQVAKEYAQQALYVDVLDAEVHRILGEAWTGLENSMRAIREFETALQLKPGDDALQLAAARAQLSAGNENECRAHLKGILQRTPDHAAALELLQSLQ